MTVSIVRPKKPGSHLMCPGLVSRPGMAASLPMHQSCCESSAPHHVTSFWEQLRGCRQSARVQAMAAPFQFSGALRHRIACARTTHTRNTQRLLATSPPKFRPESIRVPRLTDPTTMEGTIHFLKSFEALYIAIPGHRASRLSDCCGDCVGRVTCIGPRKPSFASNFRRGTVGRPSPTAFATASTVPVVLVVQDHVAPASPNSDSASAL